MTPDNKEVPGEFIPDGDVVLDEWDCDRCGGDTRGYGHKTAGERWLCSYCHFKAKDDIVEVVGEPYNCECGANTPFRHPSGGAVCYRCMEIFAPERRGEP